MPDYVKHWLDHGGKSPAEGDTNPTVRGAGWLMQTTTDPTWDPIPDPNWDEVEARFEEFQELAPIRMKAELLQPCRL
jgi:hypothetical protein